MSHQAAPHNEAEERVAAEAIDAVFDQVCERLASGETTSWKVLAVGSKRLPIDEQRQFDSTDSCHKHTSGSGTRETTR